MIRTRHTKGFTLLELSVVLMILSLMLAGIMSVLTQNIRRARQAELQAKFDVIEAKLTSFRRLNGRLPCPADGTYAVSSLYFGMESVSGGACTTGSTYTSGNRTSAANPGPTVNFYDGANTVAGVLPVRALGLPDEALFDPWGGAFLYAVDKRITGTSAFTTYQANNTAIGSITVQDGSGGNRTTTAIALVLSFGTNGHGAYQLGGARKSAASNNAHELVNCHCDNAGAATAFGPTFIQRLATTTSSTDPTYSYDDAMRYYLRSQMLDATDTVTVP